MVANPRAVPGSGVDPVLQRIADLEVKVDAIGRKTLCSVSVTSPNGQTLLALEPSGYIDGGGNPLTSITINDPISGFPILAQTPATVVGNVGTNWFWRMADSTGTRLVATDGLAGVGLALPYIPVTMYPRWNGGQFQTATATGEASAVASSVVGMGVLWEGRIGYCSHPAISFDGMWGDADLGTATITYQATVGALTFTWTATGFAAALHQFDIHSLVGNTDLAVTLQVLSVGSAAGTDRVAAGIKGVHLRQTPVAFG